MIDEGWGADNGLAVGDSFAAKTASRRGRSTYTVTGTFKDTTDFIGDYAASDANAERLRRGRQRRPTSSSTSTAGADAGAVRAAIEEALGAEFPTAKSENQEELKDSIARAAQHAARVVYALLLLSVIVSLFGIVNTLALSIHERTRELGLLRAVGTSRRQVRRMVRYEAVITALIGARARARCSGCVFAVIVSRPLADEGFIALDPGRAR